MGGSIFNRDEKLILDSIKIQEKESLRAAIQKQIEENKKRKLEEKIGQQPIARISTTNNDANINPKNFVSNVKSPNLEPGHTVQEVTTTKVEQLNIIDETTLNSNHKKESDIKQNLIIQKTPIGNLQREKEEINKEQDILKFINELPSLKPKENEEEIKDERINELTKIVKV